MASVGKLDHYNIRTRDLAGTVAFYGDVLGLENGERPAFSSKGAWLYSEGRPVVHLVDVSESAEKPPTGSGSVDHIAFVSEGYETFVERLEGAGVEHRTQDVPGGRLRQIFVTDPNGVLIELNFEVT